MDSFLHDISNEEEVVAAIEQNFFSLWSVLGKASHSEIYDGKDMLRIISGIREPLCNNIFRARFLPHEGEESIETTVNIFRKKEVPALWWIGPTTTPHNLGKLLENKGFFQGEEASGMAIDIAAVPETEPPSHISIHRIKGCNSFTIWRDLFSKAGFQAKVLDFFVQAFTKAEEMPEKPLTHYLGLLNNIPVSWATTMAADGVIGIYNVQTASEARRQGVGTALIQTILSDAKKEGFAVAILHSSAMAYQLYQSIGFKRFCIISIYAWNG